MSKNLKFVNDTDINRNSDCFGKQCSMGIACSVKPEFAEAVTTAFTHNGVKYKMLLQCRANPKQVRIPQRNPNLRSISSMEFIRPYGILIKEIKPF